MVARPVGDFGDVQYQVQALGIISFVIDGFVSHIFILKLNFQTLRCNVDMLKLIQLGLSFTDEEGNWVDGCTCWQFNFKFSLS